MSDTFGMESGECSRCHRRYEWLSDFPDFAGCYDCGEALCEGCLFNHECDPALDAAMKGEGATSG